MMMKQATQARLRLTLDVFELFHATVTLASVFGLRLTLDVFESYFHVFYNFFFHVIKINIRCI